MPHAARRPAHVARPVQALLTRTGGFILAGGLLYLALRGVDLRAVGTALSAGDYRWLLPMIGVTLGAHVLRAWRWRLLIAGLPDVRPPSFGVAFAAVMMGYGVNYALPRAGEVVRTGVVARRTGTSFAAVLGTVVLDRLLDMAMLAVGLATVPFLLRDRLEPLGALFLTPVRNRLDGLPLLLIAGVLAGGVGLGIVFGLRRRARVAARREAATPPTPGRLHRLVQSFFEGLAALARAPRRGTLVGTTVAMWGLYVLMAYFPFLLLRTAAPYGLTLVDAWCIMLLGAIGMVVPSPGGAGSFHYVTILTLTGLWGVARDDAAAYAVLAHAAQLVVYVAAGVLSFLFLAMIGEPASNRSTPVPDASPAPIDGSDTAV